MDVTKSTESFQERIARLRVRTAVAGWEGPRSLAVSSDTWDRALHLIAMVANRVPGGQAREPFVSCGDSGSIFVRWSVVLGGERVEVEVLPDGTIDFDDDRPSGVHEVESDARAIASRVRALVAA